MKDHLPECPGNWGVGDMPEGPCMICQMLRACELRVGNVISASLVGGHDWRQGYFAGLAAAREAVATMTFDSLQRDQGPVATQRQVLAAIDALREEQK